MKTFDLDFFFKGERQYIHGTDMLHASCAKLAELGELEQLDFVAHRMTDSNLRLVLFAANEAPVTEMDAVAELKFSAAGQSWIAHLIETERKPDCRKSYDENVIRESCSVDESERQISLAHRHTQHTDIEIMVAMTKILHLKLFPQVTGSWVFCRWTSARWPIGRDLEGLSIKLIHALGTRLTRSEVKLKNDTVGYMYFSARIDK
jgi:hypothetical protein